jgi:phage shock protein C
MSVADELRKLDELRASGAINDDEFTLAKAKLLTDPAPASASPAVGEPGQAPATNPLKAFRLSTRDIWLAGVCGGLGERTPVPSWAWRIAFCVALFSFGVGLIPYILLWIFVPSDQDPG